MSHYDVFIAEAYADYLMGSENGRFFTGIKWEPKMAFQNFT